MITSCVHSFSMHGVATNCRRAAEGAADPVLSGADRAADVFAKSAFRDDFSIYLELAHGGMIVALLDRTWDRTTMRRTP
jgi:hypothetical protein